MRGFEVAPVSGGHRRPVTLVQASSFAKGWEAPSANSRAGAATPRRSLGSFIRRKALCPGKPLALGGVEVQDSLEAEPYELG